MVPLRHETIQVAGSCLPVQVHVYPCRFLFTRAGSCLPVQIHVYSCMFVFTRASSCLPVPIFFNRAGSFLPVQIHVYKCRFLFTRLSSCLPMPVDVLGEKAKMRPVQHKLYFSGKNSATLQLLREEYYLVVVVDVVVVVVVFLISTTISSKYLTGVSQSIEYMNAVGPNRNIVLRYQDNKNGRPPNGIA